MTRDPKVFLGLNKAYTALFRAADRRSKSDVGLSTSQQAILFALSKRDGLSQSEIAGFVSLGKSGLSGMLDRMEARGLLRRESTKDDARVTRIFLEPSGRDLVERSDPLVRGFNTALLEPFDEAERQVIARFLKHVTDNAEDIINKSEGASS